MSKPQPNQYPTLGRFLWARHNWRRRTGGNLLTTVALALLIGGLSGNAVVFVVLIVASVVLHLYVRRTRG